VSFHDPINALAPSAAHALEGIRFNRLNAPRNRTFDVRFVLIVSFRIEIKAQTLLARRRLNCEFLVEMVQLRTDLIRDGVDRDAINATIQYRRAEFLIWRREHLAELRDWLAECNRQLH
jgi:hypothetical protein